MNNEEIIEMDEDYNINDEKAVTVWNGVLSAALKIPGAKVNRSAFLRKELIKYYKEDDFQEIIRNGIKNSPAQKEDIDKIAKSVINAHTIAATGISFATGLPGGWWMAGTIPADLTQFYYQVIVVAQKLAFLYGWPSFDEEQPSDEFLGLLTLFIGIMSGAKGAAATISKIAASLAEQIAKKVPKMALSKTGLYAIAKQVAKWLGVSLTKQSFGKGLSKVIPILGGILSGGITMATFMPMANKLKKYLSELPLAEDDTEGILK
ncbi:MAG: hypothetical protein J6Y01_08190 [Spirochaetales bacterium]|nr:hypothetical protein [Spirochaetales bacterium]